MQQSHQCKVFREDPMALNSIVLIQFRLTREITLMVEELHCYSFIFFILVHCKHHTALRTQLWLSIQQHKPIRKTMLAFRHLSYHFRNPLSSVLIPLSLSLSEIFTGPTSKSCDGLSLCGSRGLACTTEKALQRVASASGQLKHDNALIFAELSRKLHCT